MLACKPFAAAAVKLHHDGVNSYSTGYPLPNTWISWDLSASLPSHGSPPNVCLHPCYNQIPLTVILSFILNRWLYYIPTHVLSVCSCEEKMVPLCSLGALYCHPIATVSLIALLICGNVNLHPGPRPSRKSIYPCGYCELSHILWSDGAVLRYMWCVVPLHL